PLAVWWQDEEKKSYNAIELIGDGVSVVEDDSTKRLKVTISGGGGGGGLVISTDPPAGLGAPDPGSSGMVSDAAHVHAAPSLGMILGVSPSATGIEVTNVGAPAAPSSAARLAEVTTLEPNTQSGTSYTLALTDVGKCVVCDNAAPFTLTIPKVAVVAIPVGSIVYIYQKGAGQVTVSPVDGDVTIDTNARFANKASGQSAKLMLWHRASNVWTLTGEREAV
ncbi:MAG TPA: hypothetical protein VLC09_09180, partial [Polyangiaceae bacterium]|nr:hypothetical protein [Polyangiaceae bacterium]